MAAEFTDVQYSVAALHCLPYLTNAKVSPQHEYAHLQRLYVLAM